MQAIRCLILLERLRLSVMNMLSQVRGVLLVQDDTHNKGVTSTQCAQSVTFTSG